MCENSQANYGTNFNAGSSLNWSLSGGSIGSSSANNDTIAANWGSAGTGIVSVHEVNSFGCSSDTSIYPITINTAPSATSLPDSASLCQNSSINLTGTAIGT